MGAADPGAVQVLEGDGGGVETGELGVFGVVGGEGERDGGVVDGVAGGDVRVQLLWGASGWSACGGRKESEGEGDSQR